MTYPVRIVAVSLAVVLVLFGSPLDSMRSVAQEYHAVDKSMNTAKSAAVSGLLDVILQGPFIVEKNAHSVTILVPKVTNHTVPVLIDADFLQPKPLNAGEYSMDITNSAPGTAQIKNPVAGTTILQANGKTESLSSDPGKKRYMAITMPLPQEIVPWNADPMWASMVPMPPQPQPIRAAVMLVLRYNYSASTKITFIGTESDNTPIKYSLQDLSVGSEHVIALVQGMKTEDVVDHPTAKDSFEKMKGLEQNLSRYLDFPDLGDNPLARNQPLVVGIVPKELTDFLTANGPVSRAGVQGKDEAHSVFRIQVSILLAHSDCRAPILYVDNTQ
ncbi:MAG TPA: hypothetical protein VNH19_17580 [Candidatus Limnocylindrales bacterium]|nr:hypothetical protein [Candidatus Limnocylindrales bacterium]